jgi:hypothetical protein
MKRLGVLFCAAMVSFTVALAAGCASSQKTTTVTTTTRPDGGAASAQAPVDPSSNGVQETSTAQTTQSNEPDSVLGATAHAIGTIILFPFRLIGDALDLIF